MAQVSHAKRVRIIGYKGFWVDGDENAGIIVNEAAIFGGG